MCLLYFVCDNLNVFTAPNTDFEWKPKPILLLNNTQRRVCIDLPVYDDTALEQSEWATLSVIIDYATNTSVVRPVTNIRIDDNGKCSQAG